MPNDFDQHFIDEFRANQGRVGGPFEGGRLILLTTTGARSGAPHTNPVGYLPDGGNRILILASAGGAPKHPDWFHNLVADPRVTVEDGTFTYEAEATVLKGDERDRIFARAAEADTGWAGYQAKTTRVIPVVALTNVSNGPPNTNAPSWGAALKLVHDAFRRELATIRKEVAASGPILGAQLRVNCLTACHGLQTHHAGEDLGIFPFLQRNRPEILPMLDRLRAEHERLATLLTDLQAAVSAVNANPATVRREVERLTAELEDHLAYEENQLIPMLDATTR
jgi:deazaflavin-dependent oxidoreductase (nitroreductase family)